MNSKILVIVTVIVLAVISVIGLQFKKHESLLVSTKMGITGNPTLGSPKANIDIVVFEEPKCPACKTFSDTIYPKIRKNFVATNKATYTLIPISFIKNSMPAAIALFCVYHQDKDFPNSELFFKYVEHMYANQPSESEDWATPETLKKFATETSPVIKIDAFQDCLRNETYRDQIEKNTKYTDSLMNHKVEVPAVYVNGSKVEDISYSNIEVLINKIIKQQGDHHE